MVSNKNMYNYLVAAGLIILLKIVFTQADNDNLFFLLKPTDRCIGILTGSTSVYLESSGYYHEKLNIVINKSCSGYNFWLICFAMLTFLLLQYADRDIKKLLVIPVALLLGYILTLFVNTSRIFASIIIYNQAKGIQGDWQHVIHQTIGITTNLTFLVAAYYITQRYLNYRKQHAEFT